MGGLKGLCGKYTAVVLLIALVMRSASIVSAQEQFVLAIGVPKEGSIPPTREQDRAHAVDEPLTWSQPPVEKDPTSRRPIYCGWGEPAFATRPLPYAAASWTFVADDFRCLGDLPVTSVHWWGSYRAWSGGEAPRIRPESWRIGFWSHAPADSRFPFRRPNRLLWVIQVPAARVQERKAETEESPRDPVETIFECLLRLEPREYFRPGSVQSSEIQDHTFWISVTAVYTGSPEPVNPWAWQSRPQPWGGGAVRAEFKGDELRAGFFLDPSLARPVMSPSTGDRRNAHDMAFELATAPEYILWEQPFTGMRQWANHKAEESLALEGPGAVVKSSQPPDTAGMSGDVDRMRDSPAPISANDFESRTMGPITIESRKSDTGAILRRLVADDWMCRSDQPVTGMVWWGSYLGSGYLPCESQRMVAPKPPDSFLLSIWSDEPGSDRKGAKTFGHPGRKLWEYQAESFDEVLVDFNAYRYTVRLPQDQWFRPKGPGSVYWLSVVAVYKDARSMSHPWGWINHPSTLWDRQTLWPLAHWKLDEPAGRIAADSAGGNDGVLVGDPVWRPWAGWIGGAIDLDGRDDHIRIEPSTRSAATLREGFDFAPGSFSVSTWIYPRQTRGQWHAILEHDREGVNRNRFGLWLDPEGRFHFRVGQNTWHSQQNLIPNQWTHLAAVFDADARTMSLYVNGVLDGLAMDPKGFATPYRAALIIGARGSADGEFFNGLIDDLRVFRSALEAEDVLTLVGAGRNEGAVAGVSRTMGPEMSPDWTLLLGPAGQVEDMSFLLLTQPCRSAASG